MTTLKVWSETRQLLEDLAMAQSDINTFFSQLEDRIIQVNKEAEVALITSGYKKYARAQRVGERTEPIELRTFDIDGQDIVEHDDVYLVGDDGKQMFIVLEVFYDLPANQPTATIVQICRE